MKKYISLFICLLLTISVYSQSKNKRWRDRDFKEKITAGFNNSIRYENSDGMRATLSNGFMDRKEYSDNRDNKIVYSKEIWSNILYGFNDDEYDAFYWLIDSYSQTNKVKEEFKKSFGGGIEYSNNQGLKATLEKDIFDNMLYNDSRNNRVTYSKEFWSEISNDYRGDEMQLFYWLLFDRFDGTKEYREEYKVDIFGYLQFSNNKNQSASLSTDIFDKKVYKDSNGNKIEYAPEMWRRLLDRQKSEKKVFSNLISEYLFDHNKR